MRRLSIILAAAGATLVCGCQAATDDNGAAAANGGVNPASSQTSLPPGEAAFVQTFPSAGYPTPDTTMRGRFTIRGGCLGFESGGETYRAVLPAGSRLGAADRSVIVGARRVPLGREIVVKGGEGEFGDASNVPAACAGKAMLIGGIE